MGMCDLSRGVCVCVKGHQASTLKRSVENVSLKMDSLLPVNMSLLSRIKQI